MEESECIVCFSQYDGEEHRPRVIPCGHTMCSKCLKRAIREEYKTCPKCRMRYSASNVKDIPVNFSLEGMLKSVNISDRLPECHDHHLPLSHRCSTHKAWICQSCLREDHSSESCKIFSISQELNRKKSVQLNLSQPLLNIFKETCKNSDDCKNVCKKLIEEYGEEITRYETVVKRLQEEIKKKKISKLQMEKQYARFEQKLQNLKGKISYYDKAVTSLQSSETIKGVSRFSVEVQDEAEMLQLISTEIKYEVDLMQQAFNVTAKSTIEHTLGNHKLSVMDGKYHLHVIQGNNTSKSTLPNFQFSDENDPPLTDGILTFLDIAWPGQEPQRVYIKMLGNTSRARQHLLLVTGQCGHSYLNLQFNNLYRKGRPGEHLKIGPHDSEAAVPLLKDITVTDGAMHDCEAGLVFGVNYRSGDTNNALFAVYLRDYPGKTNVAVFGQVISGLEILQEAAKCDELDNVKIVDCGLVIFW